MKKSPQAIYLRPCPFCGSGTRNEQAKDVTVLASARNLRLIRESVAGVAVALAEDENGARLATAVACLDDLIAAAEKTKEAKQ